MTTEISAHVTSRIMSTRNMNLHRAKSSSPWPFAFRAVGVPGTKFQVSGFGFQQDHQDSEHEPVKRSVFFGLDRQKFCVSCFVFRISIGPIGRAGAASGGVSGSGFRVSGFEIWDFGFRPEEVIEAVLPDGREDEE